MTPTELATHAEALAYAKADHILLYLPQVAETLKLVPQLAAALREACGLIRALDIPDSELPGDEFSDGRCPKCGATYLYPERSAKHGAECPYRAARDFLARDVEAPNGDA